MHNICILMLDIVDIEHIYRHVGEKSDFDHILCMLFHVKVVSQL